MLVNPIDLRVFTITETTQSAKARISISYESYQSRSKPDSVHIPCRTNTCSLQLRHITRSFPLKRGEEHSAEPWTSTEKSVIVRELSPCLPKATPNLTILLSTVLPVLKRALDLALQLQLVAQPVLNLQRHNYKHPSQPWYPNQSTRLLYTLVVYSKPSQPCLCI